MTKDGYVVMSSETGVLDIEPENVQKHGRLEPGKMFLVNMDEGRIIEDDEIKNTITSKRPYEEWLQENLLSLKDIPYIKKSEQTEKEDFETRMRIFGYTQEDLKIIITPMGLNAKEAIGSMGVDTPLAVLSDKPQLLFNYFKQLFAQVTNPPLDGIREEIVTDISLSLGEDRNIFDISSSHCRKLTIQNPVISNEDLEKIRNLSLDNFKACTVQTLYNKTSGLNGDVRLRPLSRYFEDHIEQNRLMLGISSESSEVVRLEFISGLGKKRRFKFHGFDNVQDAKSIVGKTLYAQADTDDDINLISKDLIGYSIVTNNGLLIGELADVMWLPSNDVYLIKNNFKY